AALASLDRFRCFARCPQAVGKARVLVEHELAKRVGILISQRAVLPGEMDRRLRRLLFGGGYGFKIRFAERAVFPCWVIGLPGVLSFSRDGIFYLSLDH